MLRTHELPYYDDYLFRLKKGQEKLVESDSMYVSEFGDLVIMQVASQHYSSDYRCTITIDSLIEGQQEKEGLLIG